MQDKRNDIKKQGPVSEPTVKTGNASNPSPDTGEEKENTHQLLDKKAETYLRESGNIEDMPDARDEQDAEGKNDH